MSGGKAPILYVIAGANGAGKTTFAREFLSDFAGCKVFVNADLIAEQISPGSPETVAVEAGRMILEQIRTLAARRETFGFETTLSGRGHESFLREAKRKGFSVFIYYLWIPDARAALERVQKRVEEGGHFIPNCVVVRRFERSLKNFFERYACLADYWALLDNSTQPPGPIALRSAAGLRIIRTELFGILTQRYGSI